MVQEAVDFTSNTAATILIVDDEESIRRTLEGVFRDEGFLSVGADDGVSALSILQTMKPALVLLDIWMPRLDGMETLKKIKSLYPDLPVIMISGHATIQTAMQATRMGAVDFIEKPLDLDVTLKAVKRALERAEVVEEQEEPVTDRLEEGKDLQLGTVWDYPELDTQVFRTQPCPGRRLVQRTLAHSTLLYGQGLHSGRKSGLILEPLPPNSGIHFVGVSGRQAVPAHVDFVESTGFATTLRIEQTQVGTIEHLMSALCAYGISNLLIKCDGEVPVMDGSALEFCKLLDETGVEDQEGDWFSIKVDRTIRVGEGREFIQIEPAEEFTIDYTLEYPEPVGKQHFVFSVSDVEQFQREIAPARTFGFVRDIGYLQQQGLAQGGRFDNFVLIGDEGALNAELRFADEAVRHKILDAIGDLYLLGRPLEGKVTAQMTGHSDNVDLLKQIREQLLCGAEPA